MLAMGIMHNSCIQYECRWDFCLWNLARNTHTAQWQIIHKAHWFTKTVLPSQMMWKTNRPTKRRHAAVLDARRFLFMIIRDYRNTCASNETNLFSVEFTSFGIFVSPLSSLFPDDSLDSPTRRSPSRCLHVRLFFASFPFRLAKNHENQIANVVLMCKLYS